MSRSKNTDVIVVGAGPSGLSCAKVLGDAHIKTIVLEKAQRPGLKYSFSEIVNKKNYSDIFTNNPFPFERSLAEYRTYALKDDSFVSLNKRNNAESNFIVSREKFLEYMSNEVKKTGVSIKYGEIVRELLISNEKIVGVKTDSEEMFANVVVIAEGVNSLLTKQTGLRKGELTPEQVYLFACENIELRSEVIEERFNLQSGEGLAAKLFLSFSSLNNIQGIGYIYTNKNSVSIGAGVVLRESISKGININQFQEKLKNHPGISSFIKSGVTKNYSSFMLPVSIGSTSEVPLPKLYADGCLVTGGAGTLVNPHSWDLSSLALTSGKLASRTIIKAKGLDDYSKKVLCEYEQTVKNYIKTVKQDVGVCHGKPLHASDLDSVILRD